jgi:hypothetical protein
MDKTEATAKLDMIVGRAIRDEEYRKKLASDPKATLEREGLSEKDLDQVAGGALLSAQVYANLRTTFQAQQFNPGQVMWSTDLTCNERG